jgi:hypothetical protein
MMRIRSSTSHATPNTNAGAALYGDHVSQILLNWYANMAFQQRDMSGVLFRNEKKQEGDKQPNARGECMIDGVTYEVAAWTKEGKKGKFQSLSFKVKGERKESKKPEGDDDESTPF